MIETFLYDYSRGKSGAIAGRGLIHCASTHPMGEAININWMSDLDESQNKQRKPTEGILVNTDPRYLKTKEILEDSDDFLPTKLLKTTRAGATTGLCANAIDARLRFVLFAPTKEIAHKTIKNSVKYSNKRNANIKLLLSNHACLKNRKMVKEYPDVGKLPILPLPGKCEKCKYYEKCPVTDFIRSNMRGIHGVGMTYQKLKAVMFSDSETAETIKHRLSQAKVLIFDEAHNYEAPDVISVPMYPHESLTNYQTLFAENKKILPFLERFAELKHGLQPHIMELLQVKDDSLKNRMAIDLKEHEMMGFTETVAAIKEVINVMKDRETFKLSIDEVLFIFDMIMVLSTDKLVLHYINSDNGDSVHLSAKDGLHLATKRFLGRLDPYQPRKVIFTSATFGDYDYTGIFGFHHQIVMPDVMNTNEKMTIYPDTFKLDSVNYTRRYAERTIHEAIKYETLYPGIRFVCMKKNVALWLLYRLDERGYKINVDYYRSDQTIGVSSEERRCVVVGAPTAPINAYDGVANTFEQSQRLRIDNNHAAFWQAISRFKDPAGKDESFIYCVGVKEPEIKKMLTWGIDRKLYMKGVVCTGVLTKTHFAMPRLFSAKCAKIVKMLTSKRSIQHNDMLRKLKITSAELKTCIAMLKDKGIIENHVVKTKGRSMRVYKLVNL